MDVPIVTTTAEQMEHNREICPDCGAARFQHLNAILCVENEPTLAEIMTEVQAIKADVAAIASFVGQLEQAVMSHPMAKMLMGG